MASQWICLECGRLNPDRMDTCGCGIRYGHVVCRDCGKQSPHVQSVWRPPHYFCDSCKWDRYIPEGHQKREVYAYDPVWKQLNATSKPVLGVEFLDQHKDTLEEIAINLPNNALNALTFGI